MSEQVPLCRKGLHELTPENTGVQRSTGRQFCRACKRDYKAEQRRAKSTRDPDKCKAGLHSMLNTDNVYLRPGTGKRQCRACRALAAKRRRLAQIAKEEAARAEKAVGPEAAPFVSSVPPGGTQEFGRRGFGGQEAARYRLARMVRANRSR